MRVVQHALIGGESEVKEVVVEDDGDRGGGVMGRVIFC
jgi:hypothetical protein